MSEKDTDIVNGHSTAILQLKKHVSKVIPYLYKYRDVQQGSKCREVITARINKIEDLLDKI